MMHVQKNIKLFSYMCCLSSQYPKEQSTISSNFQISFT